VGGDHIKEDAHGSIGDAAELEFVLPHQADGLAECGVDFGDQRQAQGVHVGKVPIETGRHDACRLGHFAQAHAAKATAALHELAGGVQQGLAGL